MSRPRTSLAFLHEFRNPSNRRGQFSHRSQNSRHCLRTGYPMFAPEQTNGLIGNLPASDRMNAPAEIVHSRARTCDVDLIDESSRLWGKFPADV